MVYGDVAGARESFEEALRLQPYHPIALQMLRVVAIEQDDDALLRLVDDRLEELDL